MTSSADQAPESLRAMVTHDLREGGVLSTSLPGYEERSAQVIMAQRVADALDAEEPVIVEASTGTGKALDVDTLIPVPSGWKKMGELVPGDIVFDEKGRQTKVMAAFDVLHGRPCYEVIFSDGSTIVTDAEHLWASYTSRDRAWAGRQHAKSSQTKNFVTGKTIASLQKLISSATDSDTISASEAVSQICGHNWSVGATARSMTSLNPGRRPARFPRRAFLVALYDRLSRDQIGQRRDSRPFTLTTTEQMAATLTVGSAGRANHAIPLAGPLSLPDAQLPIDSYFLGAWLGDGASRNNQIVSADPEILAEVERAGYTVRSLKSHPYLYAVDDESGKARSRWQSGMTGRLRKLGVVQNKHIPTLYLRASEQQRRALLAGLLNTDGTVSRHGATEFTTTSHQLANGVHELLCSLGFRPAVRKGRARLNGKDCGPKWTIVFTSSLPSFKLSRKSRVLTERLRNYTPVRNNFRYVVAINPVSSRPVRCIQVDSESHLYLAGRSMIPTHNSLAYLLPIVRSGKVAIISTANKALQEQLFYKDIPFVAQHVQPFEAALVKGMGNYLCLDLLEEERIFQLSMRNQAFERMLDLLDDPQWNGDLDLLPQALPNDTRGRIAADHDRCAWRDCPYFSDCYVREVRDRAQTAQVVVVNHTLLLIDAAMGGFLLPERDVIVVDEAHHLEEEATRAFTVTITPGRVQSLVAQSRVRQHADQGALQTALAASTLVTEALAQVMASNSKGRRTLDEPLQEGLRLASAVDGIANSLQHNRPLNLDAREEQLYERLVKRARTLASDLRTVFSLAEPETRVYYLERMTGRRNDRSIAYSASSTPLSVADLLREKLFDRTPAVVTSATLAVGRDFSFFKARTGLSNPREAVLPLTFDYEHDALLYLPKLTHEPAFGAASALYHDELAKHMLEMIAVSSGRAFLLFTSNYALRAVHDRMAAHPDAAGYTFLVQGDGLSRSEMVRQFQRRARPVLFGLRSFWEGVDIPGEALSLVVIDKLPFDPPDDPVNEARVDHMKRVGENWFGGYVLPLATIRLKQGLGRLLRTHADRGVLAILDKRLVTKSYGRQVLAALPPARRTTDLAEVRAFFQQED